MLSKTELKYIKSLKIKKYRTRGKRFLVEGEKNVLELLNSDFETELILGLPKFGRANKSALSGYRYEEVKSNVLEQAGTFKTNGSCIAVAKTKAFDVKEVDLGKQVFALDGVSDPGNLGAIIRTLDWFGFDQLVCSESCADFYNPKVINSTMGSFRRVKVCYTGLDAFLDMADVPIYGAEIDGINLFESKIESPSVIVLGNESHGLSLQVKAKLTESITIPRFGRAESLNVSMATGLVAGYLRMS